MCVAAFGAAGSAFAAASPEAMFIPRKYQTLPASDLIHEGRPINPDQANALVVGSGYKFDLSLLNPDESTDIWKNVEPSRLAPAEAAAVLGSDEELAYQKDSDVTYINQVASRGGNFRFLAQQAASDGTTRHLVFFLSKNAHDLLLRKALLRKLGYYVPAIQHAPRVSLRFTSSMDKELFLKAMADQTFADPKRWVVPSPGADGKEDPKLVVLQDAIVMEEQNRRYNLALGYVPASLIANRRIFNSLIVPLSMVEVPESVNGFPFHAGYVTDDHVRLSYPASDQFSTSYEDARWIIRRILRLSRQDYADIVREGRFPGPVERILVEKLIARRNSLKALFNLQAEEGEDMPFDPNLTDGAALVNGKILQEKWDGYAARFSFGDPTSPLNSTEMARYFGSLAISAAIDNAVGLFNARVVPSTDINNKYVDHQYELLAKALIEYATTGKVTPLPMQVWKTPFWDGGLVLSRYVVAGSYMGTNNMIQLVDSIGLQLSAGGFFMLEGAKMPSWLQVSASASGSISRVYSHIKPIVKMKAALRYPFKNILVPLLRHRDARLLGGISEQALRTLTPEERTKRLGELLKVFKENFGIGESLIITDLVSGSGSGKASIPLTAYVPYLNGEASVSGSAQVISRLHVLRAGEDLIQIYKDVGASAELGLATGVSLIAPIVSVYRNQNTGKIRTLLFPLDISTDLEKNPGFFDNVSALEGALLRDSLEPVQAKQEPFVLRHRFKQSMTGMRLLFRHWEALRSRSDFEATPPKGNDKALIRRVYGRRKGNNFQQLVTDTANNALGEALGSNGAGIGINAPSSSDPGDTLYGESVSRLVTLDAEIASPGRGEAADGGFTASSRSRLADPTVDISYRWKGWKIRHAKAVKLLDEIETQFGFDFFPDTILKDVNALSLYSFDVDILVYGAGIRHAMGLSADRIARIVDENLLRAGFFRGIFTTERGRRRRALRGFLGAQRNYQQAQRRGDVELAAAEAQRFFANAEALLSIDGMAALAGGKRNIYAFARIAGFKHGSEDGDTVYLSNTIGRIGSSIPLGPVQAAQDRMGATEGEFLGTWLLWRLQ